MVDVTIKNVPEGCEDAVKQMAMVAIERFLKPQIDAVQVKTYQDSVDVIRAANGFVKPVAPEEPK